ncbi:MAG: hypothetical protein H6816_05660 [Phycisphaerales bacterium]|nr:hypothetical protein [Phycisphaerales bacterium]
MKSSRSTPILQDHHLLLCAFGGLVMGGCAALINCHTLGVNLATETLGWLILGAVHGPLLWPLLARRPWWCTSVVQYAGVLAAAVAAATWGDVRHVFLLPPLALWLAALACWRWGTPVTTPGCCVMCDYDLRGLIEPRCPECGTPFAEADLDDMAVAEPLPATREQS